MRVMDKIKQAVETSADAATKKLPTDGFQVAKTTLLLALAYAVVRTVDAHTQGD